MRSAGFAPSALLFTIPLAAGLTQEPRRLAQPDSVPFELASALIAAGGLGGEPQILVGSLPGWVSARIKTPANATVLGSAFIGSTVVGIISLPDAPDAVIVDMNRELAKQGWKAAPPQPSYGGGFRPAGFSLTVNGVPTRTTLCGDQQVLTLSATRRRGVATDVTLRLSPSPTGNSICSPAPLPPGYTRSPLPTLYNPSTSSMISSCGTQYGGHRNECGLDHGLERGCPARSLRQTAPGLRLARARGEQQHRRPYLD